MGDLQGLWIKHEESISVPKDHASPILDDPQRFGLTQDQIDEIYARHGETPGSEGAARDELIRTATEHGWIRIRRYNDMGTRVVVQGTRIDQSVPSIPAFISRVLEQIQAQGEITIVISDFAGGDARTFRVGPSGVTDEIEGDLSGA
ncbi:MAG: hypothetical protein ACLFR8_05295 [Alkalispirochaeta sp.]